MTLTDKEILELNELCNGLVDETLTSAQLERLESWLLVSEEARAYYVRAMALSASLCHYASEMQTESDGEAPVGPSRRLGVGWWTGILAAAACLALAIVWRQRPAAPADEAAEDKGSVFVARLTGSHACVWTSSAPAITLGDHLRQGQRIDLQAGVAEITFDSGAQVVLQGPASLEVNSPWDGTLRKGALKAYVPPEAIGFRISNPSVEVVDLGTEFSMVADGTGEADVLVLKGEVEAAPRTQVEQDSILLRATEGRHFASSGVSELSQRERAGAEVSSPVSLARFSPAMHYIHWSFDSIDGGALPAQAVGLAPGSYDMHLGGLSRAANPLIASVGVRAHALQLDGRLFGRAFVPGLSGNSPHSVAFWVRIAPDAPLYDSYAMVAWGATGKKLSSKPVHISWNRTPAEGPVGALRTDFGGGSAIATTPLRDGRWHHVAVVFSPGETGTPVQVHQYVDGKLESNSTNPPRRTAPLGSSKIETPVDLKDTLWVGSRLGSTGQRSDRFRGQIDELFVANWSLEPNEIVAVMRENRMAQPGLDVAENEARAPRR